MTGKKAGKILTPFFLTAFFPVILWGATGWAETTTYSDSKSLDWVVRKPQKTVKKKVVKEPVLVEVDTANDRLGAKTGTVQDKGRFIAGERVREVRVWGNKTVPAAAILKKVQTVAGGPLIVETVGADTEEILHMGWFSDVTAELRETDWGVDVDFRVEENPPFHRLELKGGSRMNPDRVCEMLQLRPGEIVNTEVVNTQLEKIVKEYRDAGYSIAHIKDVTLDQGGALRIVVDEGTIEKITVTGNEKVRDTVILREMRFKEGELFNAFAAQRSLQRLNNLGYFYSTQMKLKPGTDPSKVEVIVEVEEQGTATVGVGVGHSEHNGLVGTLTLEDTNFLGSGDDAKLQWEIGKKSKSNYLFSYTKPWLDKKETSATLTVYGNTRESAEYNRGGYEIGRFDQKSRGEELTFSRAAGEYTRNYVTLKHRKDDYVKPTDGYDPQYYEESYNEQYYHDFGEVTTAAQRRKQNFGETRSITLGHVYDSRDNIFNPRGGKYRSFSVEQAGFGGDFKFTKYSADFRYYVPQGKNTIAVDLAAGYATGNMPLSQRFSMGGANLRGYRENQFLGNSMLKGTVEYRVPISKKLTGLVFMDSGYAWDKRDEKKFDLDKIKFSYGLGVRFWSPIGPVKLDYGIGDDQKRFHFSFGYPF